MGQDWEMSWSDTTAAHHKNTFSSHVPAWCAIWHKGRSKLWKWSERAKIMTEGCEILELRLNKEKQLTKYIGDHCDKKFPGQDVPHEDVQNHQEPQFL